MNGSALTDFVDLHDIGMDKPSCCPCLPKKSLDITFLFCHIRFKNFQRDLSLKRDLLGQIDLCHCSTAQSPQDAVITKCSADKRIY